MTIGVDVTVWVTTEPEIVVTRTDVTGVCVFRSELELDDDDVVASVLELGGGTYVD